ncbi:MAG: cation diffusion facilitator family transporter [Gammaproteobacteria bacterium]|jgi:cation diffusion facilitator family transporter
MAHAPHHHSPDPLDARYREIRKVTVVGGVVDLLLGIVKILVGAAANSQALIADGVHSLSDLATDFLVVFAAKHSHREADQEHPYGHGRIETVATVILGVALALVAIGICYDALHRMRDPELLEHPGMLALLVALVSVVSKEIIYHYTVRAARRLRSNMLQANAWHSRSDAISSIIVVIGVGGTMYGFTYLDAIAAAAVGVMIAKIGWDLLWKSLQELIDTSLEEDKVDAIRKAILDVAGVRALHMLRTRRSGSDALVDVHILVDPGLSVSEGHMIGERVRTRLIGEMDDVSDVTVHIDPEDDEVASPCTDLPLRDEIMQRLEKGWAKLDLDAGIEKVVLHYLDGKVHADIFVHRVDMDMAGREKLADKIRKSARKVDDIGNVEVYFR